jgi:hypothetical protein
MPEPPRRLRAWRPSGLYRRIDPPTAELQAAAAELRAEFIADKGGVEACSRAQLVLIDLAVEAALKHQRVSAYLATLPSLVDKKRRRVWQVVTDSSRLSKRLQSLLSDLGLERQPKPVETLEAYLVRKAAEAAERNAHAAVSPDGADADSGNGTD